MNLDFAKEYSRKSDAELMLILKDQANLVPTARYALQAEISNRRLATDGLESEPALARRGVTQSADNEVVVNSKTLLFPKMCPRCLAPGGESLVRISPGNDFWVCAFP
jgi:hypothetical protein